MNGFMRRSLVVLVLVGVALGTTWACRPEPDTKSDDPSEAVVDLPLEEPTEVHVADFVLTDNPRKEESRWTTPPVTVKRGEGINYPLPPQCEIVWVLIPDVIPNGNLRKYSGGSEWARKLSYIAFRVDVDSEPAVVLVPSNYPPSAQDIEIGYSILCLGDTGYSYIEGDSPPRIIIPKFP